MRAKERLHDMFSSLAFIAMLSVLLKEPSAAKQIENIATPFAEMLKVATGSEAPEKQMSLAVERYMADENAEVADLERDIDKRLRLSEEHFTDRYSGARGLVGAMHGRRRGIHRGGPDHDPIWGETS